MTHVPPSGTVPSRNGHDGADGTVAANRVAQVLVALGTSDGDIGVSALARSLDLSKSVTYRILRSLIPLGLVVATPEGTYAIGPAAAALGARALQSFDLRAEALPVLHALHEETGETTTVSALVNTERVYIDQVVSTHEVRMSVELGRSHPLHAGATGKAILAVALPHLRAQILERSLPRLTEATVTSREKLEAELERIAAEGVAVSCGELLPEAGSIASPVCTVGGIVIGAISVCGPIDRFGPAQIERYKPLVRAAAAEVTAAQGGMQTTDDEGEAR